MDSLIRYFCRKSCTNTIPETVRINERHMLELESYMSAMAPRALGEPLTLLGMKVVRIRRNQDK